MDITQPPARHPGPPVPAEPHESGPRTPARPACDCRKRGAFCYHAMCEVLDLVEPAR